MQGGARLLCPRSRAGARRAEGGTAQPCSLLAVSLLTPFDFVVFNFIISLDFLVL